MPYDNTKDYCAEIVTPWATDPDGSMTNAIIEVWQTGGFGWENLSNGTPDGGSANPASNLMPDPNLGTWVVDRVNGDALNALDDDPGERFNILWADELEDELTP